MSYPSLLFTDGASGHRIDRHVFEDIKLSSFFSDESLGAMRVLCSPSDIPVRQDLLRFLDGSPNVLKILNRLSRIAVELLRLHSALQDVKCENERHYIYVGLMAAFVDFSILAASLPDQGGPLLRRFGSRFRSDCAAESWHNFSSRALNLREAAEKASRQTFRMSGDNLWMRPDHPENYIDRLRRCATDLKLPVSWGDRDYSLRLDARMINALAKLHPDSFFAFREFYAEYADWFDESILSYRFELDFYIETLRLMDRIRAAGLPLSWPTVSSSRIIKIRDLYDISLLLKENSVIIPNNVEFSEDEPFFFLTGANGGGKTTYLRALANAVVLFLSGCPVCAEDAEICPLGCIYTHFPQDERFESDGRYADELKRMKEILDSHGGNSLILLNETFSTTNEELAVSSTLDLAEKLRKSGSFTLYITHQQGLESAGVPFLSVIVDTDDQNRRTFRIARRKDAEGSYAADILRRYGLDEESLKCRFPIKGGETR